MSTSKSANKPVKIRFYQPWPWKLLFPTVPFKDRAFTWGDTIYADRAITNRIMRHELVHAKQQKYSKVYGFFCILLYKFSTRYHDKCEAEAKAAE